MGFYNVKPRYTPGSPAMVSREIAKRIAGQERAAYEEAVEGIWGAEWKERADREGVGGIVIYREEEKKGWRIHDLITNGRSFEPFPREAREETAPKRGGHEPGAPGGGGPTTDMATDVSAYRAACAADAEGMRRWRKQYLRVAPLSALRATEQTARAAVALVDALLHGQGVQDAEGNEIGVALFEDALRRARRVRADAEREAQLLRGWMAAGWPTARDSPAAGAAARPQP